MQRRWSLFTAVLLASSVATGQQSLPIKDQSSGDALVGIVVDSLRGRGLPGAQVILDGTTHSAITDSLGRFIFHSVTPGQYKIVFFHPLLDSLSVSLPARNVVVPLDTGKAVMLAVPSARTLISAICPGNGDNGTSILAGNVIDADTDEPISGASVIVSWTDVEVSEKTKISIVPRMHAATTDRSGAYRVCGLPSDFDATVTASRDGDVSAELRIAADHPDVIARSLTLGLASLGRGERKASLSGIVKTSEGVPLEGARVAVPGAPGFSVTDARGQFSFAGLPSGTKNVFVRRIGFIPGVFPVELTAKETKRIDAVMEKYIPIMDTVYVRARLDHALASVGFVERRRRGLGSYKTRSDWAQTGARRLSDILRTMRGVRVGYVGGETVVSGRFSGFRGSCVSLIVDRAPWRIFEPTDLDNMLYPDDIAAIEVYDASSVPAEFETSGYRGCLTIVIWTRARIRDRER